MTPSGADGQPGARKEVGTAESSRKHPPHASENAEGEQVQDSTQAPNDIPTLPANAHGKDQVSTSEGAAPLDPESMYDRRPAEGKDTPQKDGA